VHDDAKVLVLQLSAIRRSILQRRDAAFLGLGYLCQVELDAGNELGREAVTIGVPGIRRPLLGLGEQALRFRGDNRAATVAALSASAPATAGCHPNRDLVGLPRVRGARRSIR
jgi:hypothetical protein